MHLNSPIRAHPKLKILKNWENDHIHFVVDERIIITKRLVPLNPKINLKAWIPTSNRELKGILLYRDWVFYLCAIIKYWNDLCTIEIWKSSPIPSLKFLLLCIPLPSACRSILTEVATNQSKNYLFYLCAIIKVQNDLCTIEKTKLLVWGPKWIQIKKWSTTKFHNFLRSTIFI